MVDPSSRGRRTVPTVDRYDDSWDIAHANIVGAFEVFGSTAVDGEVEHVDGVLTFASSRTFPGPFQIGALRDDASVDAVRVVERSRTFFGARSLAFCLWTAPADVDLIAAAEADGFLKVGDVPVMVAARPVIVPDTLTDLELRLLGNDDTELAAALAIMADAAYAGVDQPEGTIAGQLTPAFFAHEAVHTTVALIGSEVAAAAMTVTANGSASVHFVATAIAQQRRGLAELVTATVTNHAFDDGAPQVSLQASDQGYRIYERLGFEDVGSYSFWLG